VEEEEERKLRKKNGDTVFLSLRFFLKLDFYFTVYWFEVLLCGVHKEIKMCKCLFSHHESCLLGARLQIPDFRIMKSMFPDYETISYAFFRAFVLLTEAKFGFLTRLVLSREFGLDLEVGSFRVKCRAFGN